MTALIATRQTNQYTAGYRQAPARPFRVELSSVLGLQACCTACRGRMVVYPPDIAPGQVACLSCGREWAEVVHEIPARLTLAEWLTANPPPKRGRPRRVQGAITDLPPCRACGIVPRRRDDPLCGACRVRRWQENKRKKSQAAS